MRLEDLFIFDEGGGEELLGMSSHLNAKTSVYRGLMRSSVQTIRTKHGGTLAIHLSAPLIKDSFGKGQAIVCFCRNINELIHGEKLLDEAKKEIEGVAAERMAALGLMAGGVAHEVNNPLSIILLTVEQLKRQVLNNKISEIDLKGSLDKIEQAGSRIGNIVASLKVFYQGANPAILKKKNLLDMVGESLDVVRDKIDYSGVDIILDVPRQFEVECYDLAVKEGVFQVLKNAVEAARETEAPWVRISAYSNNSMVALVISDSGTGIGKEDFKKIMVPFFTTKPFGSAMGLGLSIAKGIFDSQGINLFYNDRFSNTTFEIQFKLNRPFSS